MSIRVISLAPHDGPERKMKVVLELTDSQKKKSKKTIRFGGKGYKDYTIYHSEDPVNAEVRKDSYIARHSKAGEDWTLSGVLTKGFWSRWILWNLPTVEASLAYTMKKFGID